MNEAQDFKWPDAPWPDRTWWELTGSELNMSDELIRFSAAIASLGGVDSRNNSLAAKLAGLNIGRTAAFRYARSVSVRKILGKAEQLKSGKHRPLTDQEIDQRLAEMVRSANDIAAARAIELLDRRRSKQEPRPDADYVESRYEIMLEYGLYGVPFMLEVEFKEAKPFGIICDDDPCFKLIAPFVRNKFPELWEKYRNKVVQTAEWNDSGRERLQKFDAAAIGPELTDEQFREAIAALGRPKQRDVPRQYEESNAAEH